MAQGRNVQQVAEQLGIRSAPVLARLERMSVDTVGAAAVQQGEAVAAVVERLGIRDLVNIARLTRYAEVAAGQPPAKRARLD